MNKNLYRDLLVKYMRYIKDIEGSDGIENGLDYGTDIKFTELEMTHLSHISDMINHNLEDD